MAGQRGWHRILTGWYKYTNSAGKVLAYVERSRGHWNVTVLPLADDARSFTLSESPHTYAEAKRLAEKAYKTSSEAYVREGVKV